MSLETCAARHRYVAHCARLLTPPRIRKAFVTLFGLPALLLAGQVSADPVNYTMNNVTVSYVGAVAWSSTAGGFVALVEVLPLTTCNGSTGVLYFNYNTAEGRTYFNIFLTAKATGMKVSLDFQSDGLPSPSCYIISARIVG
jgi:hypothetical protein